GAARRGRTDEEHARAARLAGHDVTEESDIGALDDADLAVVVNPNSPDGRVVGKDPLRALSNALGRRDGLLVVDESFMDVGPAGASFADEVFGRNVVVLRSFGKFFGLAGLRLRFALTARAIPARLDATLGPWAVSGPAIAVGAIALADTTWAAAMRTRLAGLAAQLDRLLAESGLE